MISLFRVYFYEFQIIKSVIISSSIELNIQLGMQMIDYSSNIRNKFATLL